MQGRLSQRVDGRIQAFPWLSWEEEFQLAQRYGFRLMEWTLDQERLSENPLMTSEGQARIRELCRRHDVSIPSLTGDCFMQAPFWKARAAEREILQRDFEAVAKACANVGIGMIVVPLVDNGRLESIEQENTLVVFLGRHARFLAENSVRVVFECDFPPAQLARFISRLDSTIFGINYDIGNSAAMDFSPAEEIAEYGHRIFNVHVKDRAIGGTTVPLGTGNADFDAVFAGLNSVHYNGNYVLQTARAADDDHVRALCQYRDMTGDWLKRHAA